MANGGRMLALNEGFGYRPLLSVRDIVFLRQQDARPPTTILYGTQLLNLYDSPTLFNSFFTDKFHQKLVWTQLRVVEQAGPDEYAMLSYPRLPVVAVEQESLTLLMASKDPVRGYFLQFSGALTRLFQQTEWWVERDEYE